MKKTDYRIIKRPVKKEDPAPIVYNLDDVTIPPDYPQPPKPHPGPKPPVPPVPPHPGPKPPVPPLPPVPPPQPVPVGEVVFANGLEEHHRIVKVRVSPDSMQYMAATPNGVTIRKLLDRVERQNREIAEMASIIVDMKSQINQLTGSVKPSAIMKNIADNSELFGLDENGELIVNLGGGLAADDGKVVVDFDESLALDDDGKIGLDFDDTMSVNDGKVGVTGVWGEFNSDRND